VGVECGLNPVEDRTENKEVAMITTQLRNGFVALIVCLFSAASVYAQTTNSMASDDNWTNAVAWSLGHVPSGTEAAEIQAGVIANAYRCRETNDFAGNLILREGAQLVIDDYSSNDFRDFIPADTNSAIYLYNGSLLKVFDGGGVAMPNPLVVDGAVTLEKGSSFNSGDWLINGIISGAGSVTYAFKSGTHPQREIFLNPPADCTYSGGATIINTSGIDQRVVVYANKVFGTGNVTISTNATVVLNSGSTPDVIDDSAALYIEGSGLLNLGSNNEQVFQCYIDGIKQPDGDYTSAQSWLVGTGTLTVKGSPSGTVMIIK